MTEQQAKRRSPLVWVILILLGAAVAGYVYWSKQTPAAQIGAESAVPEVAVADAGSQAVEMPAPNTESTAEAAPEQEAVAEETPAENTGVSGTAPEVVGGETVAANASETAAQAPDETEPAAAQTTVEPEPVGPAAAETDATEMVVAEPPATPPAEVPGVAGPVAPATATVETAPDEPAAEVTLQAEAVATAVAEEITAPAPEVVARIDTAAPRFGTGNAPVAPQGADSPEIATSSAPALSTLPQAEIPPAATESNDDQISGSASDGTVPRFDVVRIDANGGIVVAGRAAPGSTVTVRLGGAPIAEARVDDNGQFVAIINAPASEAPQALQLESVLPEQASVAGAEEFIVLPAPANAADTTPALVRTSPETVELVQPFVGEVDAVSLDTISYSTVGAVVLNGRAQPGTAIRAYANDALIGETVVGETGQWRLDVPGLDAGVYRLRIDEIDASGAVTSRVESPFQRETPEAAAAQAMAAQAGGQVIVQPGNTLWLMASQAYGEGLLYTQIFAANSESIRDPDLIYPGQVFAIPVLP